MEGKLNSAQLRRRRSNTVMINPEDVPLNLQIRNKTNRNTTECEYNNNEGRTYNFNNLISAFRAIESNREEESVIGIFKRFKLADEEKERRLTEQEVFPDIRQNVFMKNEMNIKQSKEIEGRIRRQKRVTFM